MIDSMKLKTTKKNINKNMQKERETKKREASSSDKQCGETKFNKTNEKKNARNETDCYNNIIEKKYKAEEKNPIWKISLKDLHVCKQNQEFLQFKQCKWSTHIELRLFELFYIFVLS